MSAGGLDPKTLFAPIGTEAPVGLAVSGGPDSLALMLLAHALGTERFIVYTVDHGLRPEAAEEAAMVVREATRLGFPARLLRWDTAKPTAGLQAAARAFRYRAIGNAMQADGADVLATAHHLGDQAETVMMRLAHGSGIEGLRGMDTVSHVEGVRVFRPLLATDPRDLRALVDAAGLTPADDPSNRDEGYERVRWRNALPALAGLGLDPVRIAQFATRMRDADEAIAAAAYEAFAKVLIDPAGGAVIDAIHLASLPRSVVVRVLQRVLAGVGGSRRPHGLSAVERLAARIAAGPFEATLHGCIVKSDGVTIRIVREPVKGSRARATQPTKA